MFRIGQWAILLMYVLAPAAALGWALFKTKRSRIGPVADVLVTFIVGTLLGTAATVIYAMIVGGRVGAGQIGLAGYYAIGVLLILRGIDAMTRGLLRILKARSGLKRVMPALAVLVRAGVLLGIGLPYVMAATLTFRPKVAPIGDPQSLLKFQFTPVQFESTDGIRLSAWWIPAPAPARRSRRAVPRSADFGIKTVILCHGLAGNKANELSLIRWLVPSGYNALVFDFRAHGQSGGQFTSMGDLERRDVLGAVRWLRQAHPDQAKRIVGVGADMGAAALIAAATDADVDGQAIEAIAVYGGYDSLQALAGDFSRQALVTPLSWTAANLGLSLASLHAGTDLARFSPVGLIPKFWPRPILIIHATEDRVVPFEEGRQLFDAASFPKQSFWLDHEDQRQALIDTDAAEAVWRFFETARPIPMI